MHALQTEEMYCTHSLIHSSFCTSFQLSFHLLARSLLHVQQQHATETEETCTQYNMLKIARYLFTWTGNVTYADYYERAIMNGLLGTQRMPASNQPHKTIHDQEVAVASRVTDEGGLQPSLVQLPSTGTSVEALR